MTESPDPTTRPSHNTWWKTGPALMIWGPLLGCILALSAFALDWVFDVKEGSYVMFTIPLGFLFGLGIFVAGLVIIIVAAVRRWRKSAVEK